jgi:O-antigen/teichoic acid export membrane protein
VASTTPEPPRSAPLAGFLANVATILKGTALGQAVALAAMPVLARLYSPEDFGTFQLYVSVSTVAIVFAALRFEVALLQAAGPEEIGTALRHCVRLNVVTTAFAAGLAAAWYAWFSDGLAGAAVLAFAIPASLLVAGVGQTLQYAALRKQDYSGVARSKLGQSLAFAGAGIGAGALLPTPAGLVGSDIVGRGIGAAVLGRSLRDEWRAARSHGWAAFRGWAARHRELPLVSLPAVAVSNLGLVLTPVLMYAAFDAATAGQYTLVERCVLVPMAFIAQAVSQVFMGSFSDALRTRSGTAARMYGSLVRTQLKLAIVPAVLVFALAPAAAEFVFGPEWRLAGEFARILAPVLVVSFAMAPVNMVFTMLGRHRVQFAWDASRLAVMVGIWVAIARLGLEPAVAMMLHAVATFVMQAAFVVLGFRECRRLEAAQG